MNRNHYARKKRQLSILIKKLNQQLTSNYELTSGHIKKLMIKIKKLVEELELVISRSDLKKILGTAAIIIGVLISNQSIAQSFAPRQINPYGLTVDGFFPRPAFADLDGDGDFDLMTINGNLGGENNQFHYFVNIGSTSNPQFGTPMVNPYGLQAPLGEYASPAFADLDGDGDLDLLVGDEDWNTDISFLKYYQNIGTSTNPQFDSPQTNPFSLIVDPDEGELFPAVVDLDSDGDLDLLAGLRNGDTKYYENTGSIDNPQFASPQINPFGLDLGSHSYVFPAFADLDNDGDMDLLFTVYDGSMIYFKNTGTVTDPEFPSFQVNPFGLEAIDSYYLSSALSDIDDDGDIDLFVGEVFDNISYFENTEIARISNLHTDYNIKLSPNPANEILNINSNENFEKIEIFNVFGILVKSIQRNVTQISLNDFQPGSYTIKITKSNNTISTHKIIKK